MGAKEPVLSTEERWLLSLKPDLAAPSPAAERFALVHRPRAILIRRPAAAIRRSAGAQLAYSSCP